MLKVLTVALLVGLGAFYFWNRAQEERTAGRWGRVLAWILFVLLILDFCFIWPGLVGEFWP